MNKPEFALYFFWYVPKTSTADKQPTMSESKMCTTAQLSLLPCICWLKASNQDTPSLYPLLPLGKPCPNRQINGIPPVWVTSSQPIQKPSYSNGKKFPTRLNVVRFNEVQAYLIKPSSPSFCEPFWPLTSYARTAVQFPPPESLSLWAGTCQTVHLRRHLPPVRPGVGDKDQATRESRVSDPQTLFSLSGLRTISGIATQVS